MSAAGGGNRDVEISCDVTTTIGDVAHSLMRTVLFAGSNLEEFISLCRGHITLLGNAGVGRGE